MDADRLEDVGALVGLGEILVLDPLEAVARNLPSGLAHGRGGLGVSHQGMRDGVDGDGQPARGEEPPQPPEAGAGAVLVDRFHVHVALPRPGRGTDDLGEERLGSRIAVQDAVLCAFLVVHHELHGDRRPAGPFRIGRGAAVADKIARIGCGCAHDVGLPLLAGCPAFIAHRLSALGWTDDPRRAADRPGPVVKDPLMLSALATALQPGYLLGGSLRA